MNSKLKNRIIHELIENLADELPFKELALINRGTKDNPKLMVRRKTK